MSIKEYKMSIKEYKRVQNEHKTCLRAELAVNLQLRNFLSASERYDYIFINIHPIRWEMIAIIRATHAFTRQFLLADEVLQTLEVNIWIFLGGVELNG